MHRPSLRVALRALFLPAALWGAASAATPCAAAAGDDTPKRDAPPTAPPEKAPPAKTPEKAPAKTPDKAPPKGSDPALEKAPADAKPDDAPGYRVNEFPSTWFWGEGMKRQRHLELTGKPAPALTLKDWRGEAQDLSKLKGKVVVVDFWATWCGPCVRAIPENVAMVKEFADDGLVFVGVHDHTKGLGTLDKTIKDKGINYPIAVDDAGKSSRAFRLAFWPTYVVIDRTGIVRAIGLQPQHVRTVVEKLLKEPAPPAPPAPSNK